MRESFIFYASYYNAIKEMPAETQAEIYTAICEYAINNKKPKLTGLAKSIFTLIAPTLEANQKRYENGKKGGKKSTKTEPKANQNGTKTEPKANQTITKTEPNYNYNVNYNENYNDNKIIKMQNSYAQRTYTNEDFEKNFDNINEIKL